MPGGVMTRHAGRIRAALVDVGGTLWPDQWPSPPDDLAWRRDRLRTAFPGLSPDDAIAVLTALERAGAGLDAQVAQDVGAYAGARSGCLGWATVPVRSRRYSARCASLPCSGSARSPALSNSW